MKDESLSLVSVSYEFLNWSCLGLFSDEKFETVLSRSRLVCFHFTQSRLGLETEGTETLGLLQNLGTGLVSVSSRMKNFERVSSRSRLVCFHFTPSRPDQDVYV